MFQAVAFTATDRGKCLVAAGSSGATTDIYLWEKKVNLMQGRYNTLTEALLKRKDIPLPIDSDMSMSTTAGATSGHMWRAVGNILLTTTVVMVSYPNWSPLFWKVLGYF